jgi:diphosphomevalonate decarboxylase
MHVLSEANHANLRLTVTCHHDTVQGRFVASAPANIALIKYMGKAFQGQNRASNPSLSYTVPHLRSECVLTPDSADDWSPLEGEGVFPLALSEAGKKRYLSHLSFLKQSFGYPGCFHVKSANCFPSQCGLASSASSFAALTAACVFALQTMGHIGPIRLQELASLSRQGSGSSCRSFMGPWVVWDKDQVVAKAFPMEALHHIVILTDTRSKTVSSSLAHQRVKTSPLMQGRVDRATNRLNALMAALAHSDWAAVCRISWQEFWDMHALFETAEEPFGYMNKETMTVLDYLRPQVLRGISPLLVTLDAGSNVHVLLRESDKEAIAALIGWLSSRYPFVSSGGYNALAE